MRTKNKMIAMLEIAIVLCSLFLVAIPAIAAQGQNQAMQKVSATEVTTASEDDYVLGIYGNANEDDTIDMGDVVYIKLAIFSKKPKTELCDAKYDGRINVLDVIQTKLIILGKEKELTYKNAFEKAETVHKPIKRIAVGCYDKAQLLRILNAKDKAVGIDSYSKKETTFFPELSKLPCVRPGGMSSAPPDYELVLSLHSDVYLPCVHKGRAERIEEFQKKLPGVTVISLMNAQPLELETFTEDVRKFGYILDKRKEAEEFIAWHDEILNTVKSRTKGLSENEKPRVYIEFASSYCICTCEPCNLAGGRNICAALGSGFVKVDPEWLMEQNPDIIIKCGHSGFGYGVDDPSVAKTEREKIMNRLELANSTAVREGRIYLIKNPDLPPCHVIGTAYFAKWLHPKLFEDLDPKAIHQEYLTEFQHLDFNVYEHGVFVYPPFED